MIPGFPTAITNLNKKLTVTNMTCFYFISSIEIVFPNQ